MSQTQHVRTRRHFLVDGVKLVNPGSVVLMTGDLAKQFVARGMGENHPGPVFDAPPPAPKESERLVAEAPAEESEATGRPERLDLGTRLARAEKGAGRAQPRA